MKDSGALVLAAQEGRTEIVEFLIARGADVNEMGIATYDERTWNHVGTPLHKAAWHDHVQTICMLLKAGADRTLKNTRGQNAADVAAVKGLDADMLIKLRRPGAD